MDSLENNPLYRAFLNEFRAEFDIACKLCYLIAIPHLSYINKIKINRFLANSHILMPSKLLKMHYTPLQVGYCDDIEIDGRRLIVNIGKKKSPERVSVNILDENVWYNAQNREFKIITIDKLLLDTDSKPLRGLFSSFHESQYKSFIEPTQPLTGHEDCLKYLKFISPRVTSDLEKFVGCLKTKYMILSDYLDDAASRMVRLTKVFTEKYENSLMSYTNSVPESIRQAIQLAVENFVVHLLHGKLMASLLKLYEREDRKIADKQVDICSMNISLPQLGAQEAFSDFVLSNELIEGFRNLHKFTSPLDVVTRLVGLIGLIRESLEQSVKLRILIGEIDYELEDKIVICSDDLIASLIYSVVQAKPKNLYSLSKYLEIFGWSSIAKDQAAYHTATFQIVVQYLLNSTIESQSPNDTLGSKSTDDISERTDLMLSEPWTQPLDTTETPRIDLINQTDLSMWRMISSNSNNLELS